MKSITFLAAASAIALAMPAQAATLFTEGNTGMLGSPGAYGFNAAAGAGSGTLSFNLDGYRSLDGVNCCTDTFLLQVNGTSVLSLAYSLGGPGTNTIFLDTNSATITGGAFGGTFDGGQLQISLPVALLAGINSFDFSYSGSNQGTGDEGWGVSRLVLSGNAPSTSGAVPEPATWAMLIAGFGLVSMAMRRKQNVTVRYA